MIIATDGFSSSSGNTPISSSYEAMYHNPAAIKLPWLYVIRLGIAAFGLWCILFPQEFHYSTIISIILAILLFRLRLNRQRRSWFWLIVPPLYLILFIVYVFTYDYLRTLPDLPNLDGNFSRLFGGAFLFLAGGITRSENEPQKRRYALVNDRGISFDGQLGFISWADITSAQVFYNPASWNPSYLSLRGNITQPPLRFWQTLGLICGRFYWPRRGTVLLDLWKIENPEVFVDSIARHLGDRLRD